MPIMELAFLQNMQKEIFMDIALFGKQLSIVLKEVSNHANLTIILNSNGCQI